MEVGLRGRMPDRNTIRKMFHVDKPETFVRIYIRDGSHVNPYTGEHMSILALAGILINGGYNIPARRIFEDFAREKDALLFSIMKDGCNPAKNSAFSYLFKRKKQLHIDYEKIGKQATEALKVFLKSGEYYKTAQPNAEYTIKKKGSDTPLVDTGVFVEHMDYKVMNG